MKKEYKVDVKSDDDDSSLDDKINKIYSMVIKNTINYSQFKEYLNEIWLDGFNSK